MNELWRRGGLAAMMSCLAVAVCAAAPRDARATLVTYSTEGSFTPGTDATGGGSTLTITDPANTSRSVTVTFTGQAPVTVNTPVVGALGTYQVNASAITGSPLDVPTAPTASTFSLTVSQTAPSNGTGVFSAIIAGTIAFNAGHLEVRFSNTSIDIGAITYGLVDIGGGGFPNNVEVLQADGSGAAGVTIQHALIRGPAPEPSSLIMLGTGAAVLGLWARGRRRRHGV